MKKMKENEVTVRVESLTIIDYCEYELDEKR